jgi:hypothetical protein
MLIDRVLTKLRRSAPAFVLAVLLCQHSLAQLALPEGLRAWSRSHSQTQDGFYYQPEVIGEDYPHATRAQVLEDIAIAKAAGARALRFGVSWLETEPQHGKIDWRKLDLIIDTARQQGMAVVPYICYTPQWAARKPASEDFWAQPPRKFSWFADFVRAAAARYRGKVLAWGLWNEPDGAYWRGSPGELAAMLKPAARVIRGIDPAAGIWMGGMAEGAEAFFQASIKKYRVDQSVNAIGLHAYPETWDERTAEEYLPTQIAEMQETLASVHSSADLWVDEVGYSDYRYSARSASKDVDVPVLFAYEHTAAYQAQMLWREHIEVLATGEASLMGWYRIHDLPSGTNVIGDANNRHLGLLDVHGRKKPAFYALRFYDQLFDQPVRNLDSRMVIRPAKGSSHAVVHVFEEQNGDVIVTGWLTRPDPASVADRSGYAQDNRPPVEVEIEFPEAYRFKCIRTYKVTGELISAQEVNNQADSFKLRGVKLEGGETVVMVLSR